VQTKKATQKQTEQLQRRWMQREEKIKALRRLNGLIAMTATYPLLNLISTYALKPLSTGEVIIFGISQVVILNCFNQVYREYETCKKRSQPTTLFKYL